MKENKSGSSEDVKSQVQLFHQQRQLNEKNTVSITNKETLLESLNQSYVTYNSVKMRNIKTAINRLAFFLQSFWLEIMPNVIKGKSSIWVEQNQSEFFEVLKKNGHIITQGNLPYSLDVCRREKQIFVIAVYDEQRSLFDLFNYVHHKIRNFTMIPIQKARKKQLNLLSIKPRQQSKIAFHFCKFNFAGELIIFSQIDGSMGEDDFLHCFAMTQFSINQYMEFEQASLNKLKEGLKHNINE